MKVYTYSQARQNLAEVLNRSKDEEVLIRRRGGDSFVVVPKPREGSPFDVPGVKTRATTADVLAAVRESRAKTSRHRHPRRRG
ncbi:MAG: type II toxin-antitoxin system Phd/YefM family antitoxin [Candidatus Binatia bacterium]